MAKVTMVALATEKEGIKREFELDHAERILAIPRSGWVLPKDSEFEFVNGSISRRNKEKGNRASKA